MNYLVKISNIVETDNTFIFQNCYSMYVELNKFNGKFINSNLYNNSHTQKLFKKLYTKAIKLKTQTI